METRRVVLERFQDWKEWSELFTNIIQHANFEEFLKFIGDYGCSDMELLF